MPSRAADLQVPPTTRLTQEHQQSEQRAEALVAAWEVEGDSRGLERMTAAFWDDVNGLWIERSSSAGRARGWPGSRY